MSLLTGVDCYRVLRSSLLRLDASRVVNERAGVAFTSVGGRMYGAKELAESFETVRKNTIQIAEDIPAEQYGFRAAPLVKSVGEMLAHVAVAPRWQIEVHSQHVAEIDFAFFGERLARSAAEEALLGSKEEIVGALEDGGKEFTSFIRGLSPATLSETVSFPPPIQPARKSRFEMIGNVKEHEMHHRGQLMLIERILGIVPHLTRRREAMRAVRA